MSQPLTDWFGQPLPEPATKPKTDKNVNPCLALYGPGPADKQCKDCALLAGICKAKVYYKCRLRKNTNGPASDHKRRWPACGRFEQRAEGKDVPLYDGR